MRSFVLRLVPVLGFVAALCCGDSHSHACTGVKLKAKDGALVYGRTMEFGVDLLSTPIVIPRRYKMQGTAPEGKPGIAWEAKYAAVGMNALHIDQIIEGTNEKGLAGGVFYMPEYAQYEATTAADAPRTLAPWEVISWILTNFASVDEVRSALPGIRVAASPAPVMNFAPPAHYVVHDIQGRSLVIEYLQGKLHMYDNPTGVITNAPTFDWHLTNLNNYVSLKSLNPAPSNFDGVQLRAILRLPRVSFARSCSDTRRCRAPMAKRPLSNCFTCSMGSTYRAVRSKKSLPVAIRFTSSQVGPRPTT